MSYELRLTNILLTRTLRDAGNLDEVALILQDLVKYKTEFYGLIDPTTLISVGLCGGGPLGEHVCMTGVIMDEWMVTNPPDTGCHWSPSDRLS